MDTTNPNIIAWLVPTACASFSERTTRLLENAHLLTTTNSSSYLTSRLPSLPTPNACTRALAISFDCPPKRPGSFILGTDPRQCDITLPKLPGISPQHCSLAFDAESRLVLNDFSKCGTAVWYDWESTGDQTEHTWLLSSGRAGAAEFPGRTHKIMVDIQGVKFQVVMNDHAQDWEAYHAQVDKFCEQPEWTADLTAGWDRVSVAPVAPLFSSTPLYQHVFVNKDESDSVAGDMYLWNMARPWEPMVPAAASVAA